MNRLNFLFGLCAMFFMASCTQDEVHDLDSVCKKITATISDGVSTRTSLGEGGKVLWLQDDDISLMLKTGYHTRYVVSGAVNSNSTDFSYDNTTPSIELGKSPSCHYALYPYNVGYTLADDLNTITVDVGDWKNQIYTAGSFEDDKAVMTAKSTNYNLAFKNAFSLLNVQLSSDVPGSFSVSEISVTSKNHALNGTATLDMSLEKPYLVCTGTSDDNKTNILSLTTPVVLTQTPKDFYLLIPAATYEADDLTIKVKGNNEMDDTNMDWSYTMTVDVECIRSKVTTLPKQFEAESFSGSTEGDIE